MKGKKEPKFCIFIADDLRLKSKRSVEGAGSDAIEGQYLNEKG